MTCSNTKKFKRNNKKGVYNKNSPSHSAPPGIWYLPSEAMNVIIFCLFFQIYKSKYTCICVCVYLWVHIWFLLFYTICTMYCFVCLTLYYTFTLTLGDYSMSMNVSIYIPFFLNLENNTFCGYIIIYKTSPFDIKILSSVFSYCFK